MGGEREEDEKEKERNGKRGRDKLKEERGENE